MENQDLVQKMINVKKKNALVFLNNAIKTLRLLDVKITFKNNLLCIGFLNDNIWITYADYLYLDEYFKENLLTALLLYKCKADLKSLYSLKNSSKNIDFAKKISLKMAGEMYLSYSINKRCCDKINKINLNPICAR